MGPGARPVTGETERTLVIERVFDAPRELVFRMWTDPQHAANWWGPEGMDVTSLEMDVRPGGAWRKCMRAGTRDYWRRGVYREVVEPERLVFTYFSDDPNSDPAHETVVTVTFEEDAPGRTRLTLRQALFESVAARDSHGRGWSTCVDRLSRYLQGAAQ